MTTIDVVDDLVGSSPELRLLRDRRPVTVQQLQASFDALFSPVTDEEFSVAERELVAAFVTQVTAQDATASFYARRAAASDAQLAQVIADLATANAGVGPFGHYREAGLQQENTDGERLKLDEQARAQLGARLAAAVEHAHLLVVRPREAGDTEIAALIAAGWSADGIVTLSQLVAFLAFQQRVITGLRAVQEDIS